MLILRTLLYGPSHGHQDRQAHSADTNDVLQMQHGSLYPACIVWRSGDGFVSKGRRLRIAIGIQVFYRLTDKGRKQLWSKNRNGSRWRKLSTHNVAALEES